MKKKLLILIFLMVLFISSNVVASNCGWFKTAGFGNADRILCLLKTNTGTLLAGTGPYGAILKSADNGNNWQSYSSISNTEKVNSLIQTSDGSILAGTESKGIFKSSDGSSWAQSGLTGISVFDFFKNGNEIYALAGLSVFKSSDNGNSWANLGNIWVTSMSVNNINAIIVSNGIIFVAGSATDYVDLTQKGYVFSSSDNGATWTAHYLSGSRKTRSMLLASDGKIYAGTEPNGSVFVSGDNGANWNGISLSGAEGIYSLFQASDSVIYAGTMWNAEIFKSNNSGQSWESMGLLPEAINVYSLNQANDGQIIAVTRPESDIFKFNCINSAPIADAGNDLDVEPDSNVSLDGSNSVDPEGDAIRYFWTQISGSTLNLRGANTSAPNFTAGQANEIYVFQLIVKDDSSAESDPAEVSVTVKGSCNEGETEECMDSEGCEGTRECREGIWESCIKNIGVCSAGEKIPCFPKINRKECTGITSWRECNSCGTAFNECDSNGFECCSGEEIPCTINGCGGVRLCENAVLGDCFKTDLSCKEKIPCENNEKCRDNEECSEGKCKVIECEKGKIPKEHECIEVSKEEEILYYLEKALDETSKNDFEEAKRLLGKAKKIAEEMNDQKLIDFINNAINSVNSGKKTEGRDWIIEAINHLLGKEKKELIPIIFIQIGLALLALISLILLIITIAFFILSQKKEKQKAEQEKKNKK
ncbi:MAG: PKD domain-containing protein [Candidatus Diapherotrites archaeon]